MGSGKRKKKARVYQKSKENETKQTQREGILMKKEKKGKKKEIGKRSRFTYDNRFRVVEFSLLTYSPVAHYRRRMMDNR